MLKMRKIVRIKGMSCGHCQKRVEAALNKLPGVQARVNLKKEEALLSLRGEWNEGAVRAAVQEAGYEVVDIFDKKGLFSR